LRYTDQLKKQPPIVIGRKAGAQKNGWSASVFPCFSGNLNLRSWCI